LRGDAHGGFCERRRMKLPPPTLLVVMVSGQRNHGEALREEVTAVLAPLGLRLSPEKTCVVHIDEGFDFLSMHIRRMCKRGTQKRYVCTKPSRKAIQAIKDKVKAKTYRSTRHQDLDELLTSLNRTLAGWANYHRYGVSKATFNAVDSHAWGRIMRWIRAKYKGKTRLGMKQMGVRRPGHRRLPAEVFLGEDRAAHHGQRLGITR